MTANHSSRIAIGALLFEGNTFSPNITERIDFESKYLVVGDELLTQLAGTGTEMGGALASAANANVVPLLATHGGAGGTVSAGCYQILKGTLLDQLRRAGQLDGVYLALHGAFVTADREDVEGDVLAAVREIVGSVPIVVSCDMHAHITPKMLELADILIGYQHYPHDDTFETGQTATRLLLDTIDGTIKPLMVGYRAPLLIPAQKQKTKGNEGPMVAIRRLARELEVTPLLAVSYFAVQPWLDFPKIGFTAVAVADNNEQAADRAAFGVAQAAWDRRREFFVRTINPRQAIAAGLKRAGGPIILAEVSDCVGGGATGDSAVVLAALLAHAAEAASTIHIVDAETVALAEANGIDGVFTAHLGNKLDRSYGAPVEVDVRVLRLVDGRFTYRGGLLGGVEASLGRCAVLQVRGIEILVSSLSSYEYADEHFRAAGINPWSKKFVVVKNPMNYRTAYADAPASYDLATPGPTTPDLAALPWQKLHRPVYPLDEDFEPFFERL